MLPVIGAKVKGYQNWWALGYPILLRFEQQLKNEGWEASRSGACLEAWALGQALPASAPPIASKTYLLPAGSALSSPEGNVGPIWFMRATTILGQETIRYVCPEGCVLDPKVHMDAKEAHWGHVQVLRKVCLERVCPCVMFTLPLSSSDTHTHTHKFLLEYHSISN